MSSKSLKVDELRVELSQRGLDTTGTKRILVRRLDAAIRKEKKQSNDSLDTLDASSPKAAEKIPRDSDVDASTNDIDDGVKEEVNGYKKNKEGVATKKGTALLDQWLPDHIKTQYHVIQQGDEVYDATLNQTNVGNNTNKFYVIQVLESDDGGSFMVYTRGGRVGVKGQNKLAPHTSSGAAILEFKKKFFAKTKNRWSSRKDFKCHPKSHTWLEMDYSHKEEESSENANPTMGSQLRQTRLEPTVAKFVSLICNASMMQQIGYNAEKFPLGKLSKSTILKGYDVLKRIDGVLKRIADVIALPDREALETLSGEFYTVIPHDFGFKKMREFVIDTHEMLMSKLQMVKALGEIELETKLLDNNSTDQEDPLCSHYQRLHCELKPLGVDTKEFSLIAEYMQNSHAETHSDYSVDIVQIFKVSKDGEAERFAKFCSTKNRMLLWHGSRLTNWTGILSQGLRIAPPEAQVTGCMFGKGVYFADMFSKSANFCDAKSSVTSGVLLLCEVALGDMEELLDEKSDADKLPVGKLSTKGVGATAPDLSEAKSLEDGLVVPLGKPRSQPGKKDRHISDLSEVCAYLQ